MDIEIDGANMRSEAGFHRLFAEIMDLAPYYGNNLDALWDSISTNIERPLVLRWKNSSTSKEAMGDRFDRVVAILRRAELLDAQNGSAKKFELHLE